MTITVDKQGNIVWHIYRKSYKKARWRRVGQRCINDMLKNFPGYDGLIIVI